MSTCTIAANAPTPTISVVIPCWNGSAYIAEALDSVLAQTLKPFEVIVVDDGSTDDTPEVLARYSDRVHVIRQPNGGLASARNTGVEAATGEFIALMDHDDVCEPHRLAWQLAAFQHWPQAVLCSSEFSAFNEHGPLEARHAARYYDRCSEASGGIRQRYPQQSQWSLDGGNETTLCLHGDVYETLALGNFVHPPTVMFRRSLWPTVGPFDGRVGTMCDWDWLVRAARQGPFVYVDAPLLRYRRSATQMSSTVGQARGLVSALRVACQLVERDPALLRQHRREFRQLLAGLSIGAAYALAPDHPGEALQLLLDSIVQGHCSKLTLSVLVRMLIPQRWLAWRATRTIL